ncbi:hypothetical protein LINPERPRIM_LOCUS27556 [Linum perenne]
MAAFLHHSSGSVIHHRSSIIPSPALRRRQISRIQCDKTTTGTSKEEDSDQPGNKAILKVAWYASELLGVAASLFRSPSAIESPRNSNLDLPSDGSASLDRSTVVQTIKEDFQRSYFVTGNLTADAYEENCEFADPAGSFKGLRRFMRNCSNFGLLIQTSNMKLTKWEEFEEKGIGHWKFSCIMSFPWRPILSATGFTEYYFDPQSGRVCR